MNIVSKVLGGAVMAAALGGGIWAGVERPPTPPQATITEQNYEAGTEQYIPGHTYKVTQALANITAPGASAPSTRACYIEPTDPKEADYWAHTLVQPNGQHLPSKRENIQDPTTLGKWSMFPARAQVLPSGPIDTAICTATYDGNNGTYYVQPSFVMKTDSSNPQNAPTVDQLKVTLVDKPGVPVGTPLPGALVPAPPAPPTPAPASTPAPATPPATTTG